jgi:hypothetical protein
MNRTLLSAVLVIALTAINCFAAESQQAQATAASPGISLPAASQALANPTSLSQQPPKAEAAGSAVRGEAVKSSPIVEAGSQQDGISPQKTQLEGSTFPQQAATAAGAPADKPCASCNKTSNAPRMRGVNQGAQNTSPTQIRKLGMSAGPAKTHEGGCQTCKKKTVTSGDGTTATETTK